MAKMGRPRKIENVYNPSKDNTSYSEGHKSAGILDDSPIRTDIATREIEIQSINKSGEDLVICENGGDVGIGTTTPADLLTIKTASEDTDVFSIYTDVERFAIQVHTTGTDYTSFFSKGTRVMSLNENGNLGIGTKEPDSALHILKGVYDDVLKIEHTDGSYVDISASGFTVSRSHAYFTGTGAMTFKTGGSRRMRISSAGGTSIGSTYYSTDAGANNLIIEGNVGIGTTEPGAKLDINGTLKMTEQAAAIADTAGKGQLWVKNTTPCQLWFTDDAGTDTQIV